jgi:tRNA-dihydrouridine synthase A
MRRTIAIAPMMDYTDRHFRYLMRHITKHSLLYTEMTTTSEILAAKNKNTSILDFHPIEHPIALQLGGSDPQLLAQCAKIGEDRGYDEVNLNVGCPSQRVQQGRIGVCLMKEPHLVAECVAAMKSQVTIPVTVKCRIGVDNHDAYEDLYHFVENVSAVGCDVFIVHARKAWLHGLNPKQNRNLPPLQYEKIYRLKQDFPHLEILMNGGIKSIAQIQEHLQHVDGVMIGREAYCNPYLFTDVDKLFYNACQETLTQGQIVMKMLPYIEEQVSKGAKFKHLIQHLLGMFHGKPGAKQWRRYLSCNGEKMSTDNLRLALVELGLSHHDQ